MTCSVSQPRQTAVSKLSPGRAVRRAVLEALCQGDSVPGGSVQILRVEELLSEYLGGLDTLAVNGGTTAIEIALRAVPVGPGDEVVLPAYDWGAAAGAVLRCGAQAVFADIDPVTATLAAASLKACISARTVAVIVTHVGGCPANLGALLEVARQHALFVLEDCAQALGGQYGERPVGTFGDAAVFSFGRGKLVCAGEGGLVAFRDAALWRRAVGLSQHPLRQLRERAFLVGDMALNGRMHPLAAALILAQWPLWPDWLARRRQACLALSGALQQISGMVIPRDPPYGQHSFHRYVFGVDDEAVAEGLVQSLTTKGFPVARGPIREPLHLRPTFNGRFKAGDFPEAERRCRTSVLVEADWTRVSRRWIFELARAFRKEMPHRLR